MQTFTRVKVAPWRLNHRVCTKDYLTKLIHIVVKKPKRLIVLCADAMVEALETAEVAAMVDRLRRSHRRKESDVKRTQKNALIVKNAKSDFGGV